jgi:hypothetical protein
VVGGQREDGTTGSEYFLCFWIWIWIRFPYDWPRFVCLVYRYGRSFFERLFSSSILHLLFFPFSLSTAPFRVYVMPTCFHARLRRFCLWDVPFPRLLCGRGQLSCGLVFRRWVFEVTRVLSLGLRVCSCFGAVTLVYEYRSVVSTRPTEARLE